MIRSTGSLVILASGVVLFSVQALAQSASPAATVAAPPVSTTSGSSGAAEQDKQDKQDKDAPVSTDFQTGDLDLQVTGRPDVASSKFEEYRDVVKGVSLPAFRLFGSDGGLRFDLRGQNVKQLDERYTGYLKTDLFGVSVDYNSIVHRIGNDGRTMLVQQSPGVWTMSPTLQQAFQNIWESTTNANRVFTTFVAPLFNPSISNGNTVNIQVVRERTEIVADLAPNQPFSAKLSYRREQRHGSGGLSSNYISYEIETPSVTEYLTQDMGLNVSVDKPWGSVRGGLHYNWFVDQVPSLVFDNPFRATDAPSVTIGTGAAATGVGGPTSGRMINPPDNSAYLGALGTTLKLPEHTRITADLNLGRLTQNAQFFPYSINTAIVTPVIAAQTSSLPAQSLNGKIDTTSLVLAVTSRPVEPLHVAVRYRVYDLNNQTPRLTFPGYVSWDRTWSDGGRISVPYGYTNTRLDASADYDVGRYLTLEGAYRRTTIDRTFRETERTTENAGSASGIIHVANMANLRAMYERGSRDYSGLDLARSEDASFVVAPTGPSANALARDGSLRFDQSRRDSDRAGIIFDISPGNLASFAFTYLHNNDTYNDTVYGLQNASYDTYTGEVTLSPGERWNVSVYYTHEKNGSAQVNNGTNNSPVVDNFATLLQDSVDTSGATSVVKIVPAKVTLNLSGRFQNLVGTAGFSTQPGSSYQAARANVGGVQNIPNADNAKIVRLDASVDYAIRQKLTLTAGAWYEDYKFSDVDSVGLQNLYPGAFFLALNDGSYNVTVGYVRLTYHW
jgi:hypothetical protein